MNEMTSAIYPLDGLNIDNWDLFRMYEKHSIAKDYIFDQYYNQSKSQDEIAKQLGVSQWLISQRMMKFGFTPKSKTRNIGIRKYFVDDNFFDELNATTAWVLGWLASDGFVGINDNSYFFGFVSGIKRSR